MEQNLKLTIELVPASMWNNNLRSLLKKDMWDNLRKKVYKKYNYKCAICGSGGLLHCHEAWEYNDKNRIQKLKNIIALCSKCHAVNHIGHAGIQASKGKVNYENLVKHFMKVNNCDRLTFQKHLKLVTEKYEDRSKLEWQLDLEKLKDFE